MRILKRLTGLLLMFALACGGCTGKSESKKPITSIQQLNDPAYTVAVSDSGAFLEAVKRDIPKAKRIHLDGQPAYDAVKMGRADAYAFDRRQMEIAIAHGLKGVKILPGSIGTGNQIAVGLSRAAKIPGLRDKINQFIAEVKADGTLEDMYRRWVVDEDFTMPDIDVPEDSGLTLRVGTIGLVMPYSYYTGNKLTGYDVEFARRFAKWLGASVVFKVYDFGGVIAAAEAGEIDCIMTNLNITPERAEKIDFSDVLFTEEIALMVKNDSPVSEQEASGQKGYSSPQELDGKRIGVFTGSIQDQVVKEVLTKAECVYFDSVANALSSLTAGKIDAVAIDEQIVKNAEQEYPLVRHIDGYLQSCDSAFIAAKTPEGDKIRTQLNEFIRSLELDGTLEQLQDIWNGTDESRKILPDYENYPDTNGTLRIAAENETPPFSYIKDRRLVGYEIDIVSRFCKAYGYRPNIDAMIFPAIIPAVMSGKYVLGVSSFTITEERKENVNFSEPTYRSGTMLLVNKTPEELKTSPEKFVPKNAAATESPRARFTSIADLAGKKVGVQTGTTNERLVAENIPAAKREYFNTLPDALLALKTGKIDAVCCSIYAARYMMIENDDITYLDYMLTSLDLVPIFSPTEKGRKLRDEYSGFVKGLWADGTINEIDSVWLGKDDTRRVIKDYSKFPAPNGVLKMAVDPTGIPFVYMKDNQFIGYDVDIATRFCEAEGYGLEVVPMAFSAIISSIKSGKTDFSASMHWNPEREQSALFASIPTAHSGNVIVVMKAETEAAAGEYSTFEELAGRLIGAQTGTPNDKFTLNVIPTANIQYFDSVADIVTALKMHKIDAGAIALNAARFMMLDNEDLALMGRPLAELDAAPIFAKTEAGRKLCDQFNKFIKAQWDNGTLKKLDSVWFGRDDSKRTAKDYASLPAPNGTLKMAVDTSLAPFAYVKDKKIVGYEIDFAVKFCEEHGYGLEVIPMNFGAIIAAVQSGKCDFASCTIAVTPERAEQVLFASPNAKTGCALVVRKVMPQTQAPQPGTDSSSQSQAAQSQASTFMEELKASFNRTFIREERWMLFIEGIINTMIITVLSILCGTILGFVVYLFCRRGNFFANLITRFFVWLIEGTPMVVLLMILYYIIFGKVDISGIWVAVIAFSLTFGAGFYGMLRSGTGALDRGQTEAAYALGFSDTQTFFTVILPQAALHFMPAYKSSVVALIKSTAIVGYIAVQDLTKMGDIVRSRTYEAFFPLIAVAVIYFILAGLLNMISGYIHNRIKPEKRTRDEILRGIETHDKA